MADESHVIAERRRILFEQRDPEPFDRIAYAMRVLDILRPAITTIAVYSSVSDLVIQQGREPKAGGWTTWAMIGIPPDVTRESIAVALAELAGVADRQFVIDLLLLGERHGQTVFRQPSLPR